MATGCGIGSDPGPPPSQVLVTPEQAEEARLVKERDRHWAEAVRLSRDGRWDEAARETQAALDLERRTKGNPYVARDLLADLARLHLFREDWEAARKAARELLAFIEGPMARISLIEVQDANFNHDGNLLIARRGLADLERLSALPPGQGRRLGQAWRLFTVAAEECALGRAEAARPALLEALAIRKEILGEGHPDHRACLDTLGLLHLKVGDLGLAKSHYDRADATRMVPVRDFEYQASLRGSGWLAPAKDDRLSPKGPIGGALALARVAAASDLVNDHTNRGHFCERMLRIGVAALEGGKPDEARKSLNGLSNQATSQLGPAHPLVAAILYAEAACRQESGEPAEALPLLQSATDTLKQALGETDPRYVGALGVVAGEHRTMGHYDRAEAYYREALEIRRRSTGEADPAYAASLDDLAGFYLEVGDPARAAPLFRRASEVLRGAKAEASPEQARSLEGLGGVHLAGLDLERAEPLFLQAREIRRALGYHSYATAEAIAKLAEVADARVDLAAAGRLLDEAYEVAAFGGSQGLVFARCLRKLAARKIGDGDYANADRFARAAIERTSTAWKGTHPDQAAGLATLAAAFAGVGDREKAELLLLESKKIRMALDPAHPDHAAGFDQLANLYARMGDFDRAEPLFRRAIDAYKQVRGGDRRAYAAALANLAAFYRDRGDYALAEPLLIEARAIVGKARGESHPDYATCLNDLATLYREKGDLERAEPLVQGALAIRKAVLGEAHFLTAQSLANLGLIYRSRGDGARAEPALRQALEANIRSTFEASAVLDPRRRLRLIKAQRELLDAYLGVALGRGVPADDLYRPVLAWKGGANVEPAEEALALNRPDLNHLVHDLHQARARLARLAFINRTPANQAKVREGFEQARREKEKLEADLAARFGKPPRRYSAAEFDPKRVADALADDRSLVDLFGYAQDLSPVGGQGPRRREARLLAFVVRRGRPVVVVPLGPASPIDRAVEDWRRALYSGQSDSLAEAASRLGRLAWEPLRPHLDGSRTVLIAADGDLTRFPFAALPGREPGSYLIEDLTIGYVPSGRSLVDTPAVPETKNDHGLLAVGDVAFQADPNFFPELDRNRPSVTTGPIARYGRYDMSIGPGGVTFTDVASGPDPFGGAAGSPYSGIGPYGGPAGSPYARPGRSGGAAGSPFSRPGRSGGAAGSPYPVPGPYGGPAGVPSLVPGRPGGPAGLPFSVPGISSGTGRPGFAPGPKHDVISPGGTLLPQPAAPRPPTPPPANAPGSGFAALPGTAVEVQAAKELFRLAFQSDHTTTTYSSIVWTEHHPTEGRIKRELDGTRTRFVHFATHGFFDSPERIAAIRRAYDEDEPSKDGPREALPYDLTPLLRCGIVLAGGGRPPTREPDQTRPSEDGILTAEEVQGLDLRGTQLVVLSACETGLGSLEAGQGVFGLQSAFQSAGARAVVASLWRVDDAATSLLMERFYTNLWSRKLPRLEALRLAQIDILKDPKMVDRRRVELAARGIAPIARPLPKPKDVRSASEPSRSDPSLWAAFLLSGEGW